MYKFIFHVYIENINLLIKGESVMECKCDKCGMGVKNLTCSKCNALLVSDMIKTDQGEVHVAKCPNGCGKIKSPVCCGQDMICTS